MNVFRLADGPVMAARYHCDQHVNKMLIEAAQMLSTALREQGVDDDHLYRSTHVNHPTSVWVREGRENFAWVRDLAVALAREYARRYDHDGPEAHKTYREVITEIPRRPDAIPEGSTPQPLAMPDEYHTDDPVEAYRAYYRGDKREFATYERGRDAPDWFVDDEREVIA